MTARKRTKPMGRRHILPPLLAVLAASLSGVTCDLITSPKSDSGITVEYTGTTRLVVGTLVSFAPQVLERGVAIDGARLAVRSSDSNIIAVRDLDGGFAFVLDVKRRGQAIVRASFVSSTLMDAPPATEALLTAVAAKLRLDSAAVTFHSVEDTLTLRATALDGRDEVIAGAVTATRWRSTDAAVAAVDSLSGKVTARGNGAALVVAVLDSTVADTVAVTVEQRLVAYGFAPISLVLASIGLDTTFVAVPLDARGHAITAGVSVPTPVFATLNAGVVTISSAGATGRLRTTGNGTTGIRVTGPGTAADDTIPVTVGQVATRVSIAGARTDTIEALHDTLLLLGTAVDAVGTEVRNRTITWFSRNSAVAQVDPASGHVRGVGLGATRVIAQMDAASDSVAIAVLDVPRSVRTTPVVLLPTVGDTVALADSSFNRLGSLVPDVPVSWRALDTAIAAVDTAGLVVARGVGATRVIGTIAGGYADSTLVTVENRVAGIDITHPDTALASIGDTVTVRAALVNSRGAPLPLSAAAWTSSDTGVVKVANGFLTATRVGFSAVYAVDPLNPARFDSVRVTVTNAPDAVTLNRLDDTLTAPTRTLQYTAVVRNARGAIIADPALTWRSSNASVASVSPNGLATALAVGATGIVAEATGGGVVRADTALLVVRNDAVSLTVSPTDFIIPSVGATVQLGADARNVDGGSVTAVAYDWSSSDTAVAAVSSSGLVTGVRVGTARITARLASLTAGANATVTNAPDAIDIVPATITLASVNDTVIPDVVLHNALGVPLARDAALWTSDNGEFARVTSDGHIIAVGRGTTYVRAVNALNPARRDSVFVEVTNAPAAIDVLRTVDSLPSLSRTLVYTANLFNARGAAILDQAVAWTSRAPSVATVSASTITTGVATSVGIGQTWIVGSAGAVRDSALLIVSNRAGQVAITPASASLASLGDTLRLSAIARNELGNVITGATVAWASANPAIVTVSTTGLVTAVGTGSTTVSATVDGIANAVTVSVSNAPTTVLITSGNLTLASVGDQVTPSVDFRNALGSVLGRDAAVWTSGNANVATVSGTGVVTATGAGTVTITATSPVDASRFSSITVTVTNAAVSIALNRTNDTLTALGRTLAYTAEVRNQRGDLIGGASVAWTSSHPQLVTIGAQSGSATAVAVGGPVTITATTSNALTQTAQLRVTNNAVSLVLAPDSVTIPSLGGTSQLTVTALNNLSNPLPDSNIAWSSLDPARATVSAAGLVTATTNAANTGLARVVASANAGAATKADTTYVTVLNAPATVAFTSGDLTLASIGDAVSPAVTITNQGGVTLARTAVTWTSSAPNIASVSNAGLVTGQGVGSAVITATSPYDPVLTSSITVAVTNAPATVTLNASAVTLTAIGRTTTLSGVVRNGRGDPLSGQTVQFASNSPRVTVGLTDGIAVAVDTTPSSPATPATITATVVGTTPAVTTTAAVTVTNEPTALSVTPTSRAFTSVLDTALVTAAARNDLGNVIPNARIRWTTGNAAVVRFVSNGTPSGGPAYTRDTVRLRAEGVGSTTVTAADSATGVISAALAVTVTNDVASIDIADGTPASIPALQDTLVPAVTLRNGLGQPIAARDAATWSSSNTVVATVSTTGIVTGIAVGTAYVRAVSPANAAVRDSFLVTVSNLPDTVTITPAGPDTMTAVAQQLAYSATVKNRRGAVIADAAVAWTSTATGVATVDGSGVVTAVAGGDARIVATSGTKADTVLVHVDPDPVNWYVNKDVAVSGTRTGTLARPFSTIQAALAVATPGDVIWVKRTSTAYTEAPVVGTSVTLRAMPADTIAAGCSTGTGRCTAAANLPTLAHNSGPYGLRLASGVSLLLRQFAFEHTADGPAIQSDSADLETDFVYVNPSRSTTQGRGILVRSDPLTPNTVLLRRTHIRQVRGYGVRLEGTGGAQTDGITVDTVSSVAGTQAGIHVLGGTDNRIVNTRIGGTAGQDGIRLSNTRNVRLRHDTVVGGRYALRADSSSWLDTAFTARGAEAAWYLGAADTVAVDSSRVAAMSHAAAILDGPDHVGRFDHARVDTVGTATDSAAFDVRGTATGAALTVQRSRIQNADRRAVRMPVGRSLVLTQDTLVGAGSPSSGDPALAVVATGTLTDSVVVSRSTIRRVGVRWAMNLAATDRVRIDSNYVSQQWSALVFGNVPAWYQLRKNDLYDFSTATAAVGLPAADSALLDNWWGDGRGPRRVGLSAAAADSAAAGDSVEVGGLTSADFANVQAAPNVGIWGAPGAASDIVAVRGTSQATTTSDHPFAMTARVRDASGRPASGVSVTFSITAGADNNDDINPSQGGNQQIVTVLSDASGLAEARISLGGQVGTRTVTAGAGLGTTATFSVTRY